MVLYDIIYGLGSRRRWRLLQLLILLLEEPAARFTLFRGVGRDRSRAAVGPAARADSVLRIGRCCFEPFISN